MEWIPQFISQKHRLKSNVKNLDVVNEINNNNENETEIFFPFTLRRIKR